MFLNFHPTLLISNMKQALTNNSYQEYYYCSMMLAGFAASTSILDILLNYYVITLLSRLPIPHK